MLPPEPMSDDEAEQEIDEAEQEIDEAEQEIDEEQLQIDVEHAIDSVDAVENEVVMDNAINILEAAERDERDESEKHPFVVYGIPICDLAKTIFMKKRRDLSPLQYLDDETIKRIATAVGTMVLSQELCASQKTKEVKFKDVELAIVQFARKNCPCCAHLQYQL